ncbi:hypothetical protein [Paenibacillus elgii]|uniref:hypothetical protein n=1 Tax=Paenibacillus elgii TaxID=189691 RepID=UPI000FDC8766|nr:hypothetical protein [Paenibacillus elgii]NEN83496.1 hypothetical protein [Paenibacillus elgii]
MANLKTAEVRFHTNDDDKDDDTKLSITIEKGHDQFAKIEGIEGHFPDHSENGPFGLEVQGVISKEQLQGATTTVKIIAVGNDTWKFNCFLELGYDDGSRQKWEWFGIKLNEHDGGTHLQM